MSFQKININEILVDNSMFSSKYFLFKPPQIRTCHINSFDSSGVLYPVILYTDSKRQLHLIDGRKRLQYLKQNGTTSVRSIVLPENTQVTDIITLILCNLKYEIESSVMSKLQFINFALSLNAPEPWVLKTLCMPFEFKPHSEFLRECKRINNVPHELKLFCHEKRFSLKQILNLSCHPMDLLEELIRWKSSIQLTAAVLDEIASSLNDYLRQENITIKDFLAETGINEILESSLSTREKTEKVRQLIRMKRYPVLSEANSRILGTIEHLDLPENITFNWDRTLENRNINISINIRNHGKWRNTLDTLKSAEIRKAIERILDEL